MRLKFLRLIMNKTDNTTETNRIAVITGASYGLGGDIVRRLILDKYQVYGISRTKPTNKFLRNYYDFLTESKRFTWIKCDISNSKAISAVFTEINKHIDVLVNNAGVFESKEFRNQNFYDIDKIIDVNVKGSMYITNEALRWMLPKSRIFFINSVSGLYEIENEAIYGASKHALTAFAGIIGKELQKKGISVTSIHPGGIDTPMQSNNPNKPSHKLLDVSEISSLISFICKSENVEYKNIKLFSNAEWHQ